jgi:sialate O-acetylesterase
MVLQRSPHSARIWGWSTPQSNVTVSLDDTLVGFDIADPTTGKWTVRLPPQPASTEERTIHITDGTTSITLVDVVFGDVYLCSGQSNMQLDVDAVFNSTEEINDSVNHPYLRIATAALVTADTPQEDVPVSSIVPWV